jgi:hypothetical protein
MSELFGMTCIIASQHTRVKVSKYKLIDWLYKKIYGYKEEVIFPEGASVILFDNKLYFRDKATFDRLVKEKETKNVF